MLELFNAYRAEAQHIASLVLMLAIWRWGAGPERWLIAVFVGAMVVPVYLFDWLALGDPAFGPYAWAWVAIDLGSAAAFIAVALNANRNYPLWVAGFQLVAIGVHGVRGLIDAISPLTYVLLSIGPSYCQLAIIFVGFVRHTRRVKRFGPYRDWRLSERRMIQRALS